MRSLRLVVVVSVVLGTFAFAPAAMAAGKAPGGQGLFNLQADDPTAHDLVCSDAGITDIRVPGNGTNGWVVGDPDRHYALLSISGEFTLAFQDDSVQVFSFSETYGVKAGKTSSVDCSLEYGPTVLDGVTQAGHLDFTIVRIW